MEKKCKTGNKYASERPNHPSRYHARQGEGQPCGGGEVLVVGGGPPVGGPVVGGGSRARPKKCLELCFCHQSPKSNWDFANGLTQTVSCIVNQNAVVLDWRICVHVQTLNSPLFLLCEDCCTQTLSERVGPCIQTSVYQPDRVFPPPSPHHKSLTSRLGCQSLFRHTFRGS